MRALRRTIAIVVGLLLAATLLFALWATMRGRPQDLPWTPLDLGRPVGLFTGRKITALTEDFPACRAALDKAGIRYTALPARTEGEGCGYTDAVRFTKGGARRIEIGRAHV